MSLKLFFKPALLIVIATLFSGMIACGSTSYKTFSIKEGVQGFNFEYPSQYALIRIDMSNMSDSQYTNVGLGATENGPVSEIYIYVWPTSVGMEMASAALNTLLANAANVLSDFMLDKQAAIAVNGQSAQGASFSAVQNDSTSPTPSGPGYYRITCFIHSGLIIEIDMICDVTLKDSTQGEYDHLLQTFALLG